MDVCTVDLLPLYHGLQAILEYTHMVGIAIPYAYGTYHMCMVVPYV